ncbi:Hpt domain-containing protein [Sphingobacterium sp. DN00404]|uniref:Hpt domain-containing protein n=1 Tax=Sphingobacterium micropteri TaxID=2763501 RepID=A0ABR7YTV3_9SPHI|nr:Hpt domain-containing protein [Sphingobacterium micropteri]MBD1434769.1 Hpt domain-containing protein [Sphingobacterium micropteri]
MQYRLINPLVIQETLMNNKELVLQFLGLYQEQIPNDLQALKEAVTSEVHIEIANKAHHIKPTMEYIGARALREKLQQLEYAGKNGTEIPHIHTLFMDIEREIQTLLQEIADYKQHT